MKTIWKFPFEIADHIEILMPEGAEFLAVAEQHGQIGVRTACMWCKVNPSQSHSTKRICFELRATGQPFDRTEDVFLGTFQMFEGKAVWHLFTSKTGIPKTS